MKIYIVVGSVREGRVAPKVAKWIQNTIESFKYNTLEVEIIDLKEWDLPFFAGSHPPMTGIYDQPKQQEWAEKIAEADSFILVTPEYNHGYSPALKNALDYLGKEWQGKPVAYVSYGATNGSRSIDQIRQVAVYLGMIDSNATLEIRNISQRNQTEQFEGNEIEAKVLKSVIDKLIDHAI